MDKRVVFVLPLFLTTIVRSTEQVIDIFTNYPNAEEVLRDYNRILETRHVSNQEYVDRQPKGGGTRGSKLNLYDYNKYPDRFAAPQQQEIHRKYSDYWDNFHDFDDMTTPPAVGGDQDVLESEFGVFDDSDKYAYEDTQTESSEVQLDTVEPPLGFGQNLLDLNNFMGMMATRPSFMTTSGLGHKNRRNKTVVDYVDFANGADNNYDNFHEDKLESDFGEIVSTSAVRKHKKRKGNVKRIPKPPNTQQQVHNVNHIANKPYSHASKVKVTDLLRKYLLKMHRNGNGTHSTRRNRKQANDRTLNWLAGATGIDDKKTQFDSTVKLHEGPEKFLLSDHYYSGPFETIKNKTKHIANKFLSLFTVIQFGNFRCQANSAVSQYEGTCFLATECSERNGVAMGMCAEGHGVCCVFRGTCGGVGSNNCTYFESPGYPNYFPLNGGVVVPTTGAPTTGRPLTPDPRLKYTDGDGASLQRQSRQSESANALSCIFRVYKASDNVRQMRIDFIDLELAGPTSGQCVDERLVIMGTGLSGGVPVLCGYNTGQHVYVDVSTLSGPLQLSVLANAIQRKRYQIRICQYTDGCSGLMNCLQSYTGVSGQIASFNYDQAATFSRSTPGYLNNLNYAICIRREPGYCSVTYTNIGPNGVVYPFELRNFDDDGTLSVPAGQAGAGVINCPDDYIVVNGIRLCGDRLNDGALLDDFSANAPVTDTSGGPIIIPVRTSPSATGRGFRLFYTQNPCPSSGGAAGTPDPRI